MLLLYPISQSSPLGFLLPTGNVNTVKLCYKVLASQRILMISKPKSSFPLDAIYDCASLYNKNYKISGEYKLPKDDFLGTPELNVSLIHKRCSSGMCEDF